MPSQQDHGPSFLRPLILIVALVFAGLLMGGSALASLPTGSLAAQSTGGVAVAGQPSTSNSGPVQRAEIPPAANPNVVLYDQMNNPAPTPGGVTSQDFEASLDPYDTFTADDFVVPAGQSWSVTGVDVAGEYGNGPGPALSFNVYFYTNAAGDLPGTVVATRLANPFTGGANAIIALTSPVVLTPGTYWVSVQAREDFAVGGQWFWDNRLVISNAGAAWQNPGGGFATACSAWGRKTTCLATQNGPDQLFRLNGDVIPLATATATQPPATATSTNTPPPTATNTTEPTFTPTACTVEFTDVPPTNTFYPFVRCLACKGIIQGYADGTFRPNNPVTRGQIAKIISLSAGFTEPVPTTQQSFEDAPYGSTFWEYIERLYTRGIIGGYQCGINPAEPCVPPENRPYFRPNAGATRGQLVKIASESAGFTDTIPDTQYTFTDVEPGSTFWLYIERLLMNRPSAISGYPCGSPTEPCDSENRPYFRPNNGVTRGQASKIVANTFFPGCNPPRP